MRGETRLFPPWFPEVEDGDTSPTGHWRLHASPGWQFHYMQGRRGAEGGHGPGNLLPGKHLPEAQKLKL